jgi:hypothetical protein
MASSAPQQPAIYRDFENALTSLAIVTANHGVVEARARHRQEMLDAFISMQNTLLQGAKSLEEANEITTSPAGDLVAFVESKEPAEGRERLIENMVKPGLTAARQLATLLAEGVAALFDDAINPGGCARSVAIAKELSRIEQMFIALHGAVAEPAVSFGTLPDEMREASEWVGDLQREWRAISSLPLDEVTLLERRAAATRRILKPGGSAGARGAAAPPAAEAGDPVDDSEYRPTGWFARATGRMLDSETLRMAAKPRGGRPARLQRSRRAGGRWQHHIGEVCAVYSQFAGAIRAAQAAELAPFEPNQTQRDQTGPNK